jgi:hypothetical protein
LTFAFLVRNHWAGAGAADAIKNAAITANSFRFTDASPSGGAKASVANLALIPIIGYGTQSRRSERRSSSRQEARIIGLVGKLCPVSRGIR